MKTKCADILYINAVDYGSTGKIMKQMSVVAESAGYTTYCAIAGEKKKNDKNDCIIISSYTVRRINEILDKLLSIRG